MLKLNLIIVKQDKTETLAKASKELMLKEPFYGIFLIMLNKMWDKKVPTAGVGLNGINYHLYIIIIYKFYNNIIYLSVKIYCGTFFEINTYLLFNFVIIFCKFLGIFK